MPIIIGSFYSEKKKKYMPWQKSHNNESIVRNSKVAHISGEAYAVTHREVNHRMKSHHQQHTLK